MSTDRLSANQAVGDPGNGPLAAAECQMIAYCADVGSVPKGAFGWASAQRGQGATVVKGGGSIDALVQHLGADIADGHRVSLGIEAPLFLPIPKAESAMSRGRTGEGDRSCFAQAGGYVTSLGLHELAYTLARLLERSAGLSVTLDWSRWARGETKALLLWEAFVSKSAHTRNGNHVQDAATGAVQFLEGIEASRRPNISVASSSEVFSIAGAALVWARLSTDPGVLREPTLVVRPLKPWVGSIERA